MAARMSFDLELQELHRDLIKMGSLVEESIDKTIKALKDQDVELAKQIFYNDDLIDDMEQKIERKCLKLNAPRQHVAKDLSIIATALKIITDMERIADHSADIAEITIRTAGDKYITPVSDLPALARQAKIMVRNSIVS